MQSLLWPIRPHALLMRVAFNDGPLRLLIISALLRLMRKTKASSSNKMHPKDTSKETNLGPFLSICHHNPQVRFMYFYSQMI